MSRPFPSRNSPPSGPFVRVNGKIRAREVRVIGEESKQLGVMTLGDALNLARSQGVDLVEIAPNATPPVCRLVDFGKFRYEQAKRDKESKKHQHANRVKEVQLSPKIDPHDLAVKTEHAVGFFCEDMKIKVTLKFRGREMAHTEFGFQVIRKLLSDVAPFGHPDFEPKLIGKGINVMVSPLPRNKRAKNPYATAEEASMALDESPPGKPTSPPTAATDPLPSPRPAPMTLERPTQPGAAEPQDAFANNPFAQFNIR